MPYLRILSNATGCVVGFSCNEDIQQQQQQDGFEIQWKQISPLFAMTILLFLLIIGIFSLRGILGCIHRRKTKREIQNRKDSLAERYKFIKERLPVSKWTNEVDCKEKDCAICMEDFEPGAKLSRSVPGGDKEEGCQHVYHSTCIRAWLLKHHECPICRGTFLGAKESELFKLNAGASDTAQPSAHEVMSSLPESWNRGLSSSSSRLRMVGLG
mmetsp:Transcript_26424/g.39060  ORF Transcript_26424/g.39060 Transcript_26424/m.39060 type:complete len:213 (-) Transcript_26424:86-724(-)